MATVTIPKLIAEATRALTEQDLYLNALREELVRITADLRHTEKRRAQLKTRLESLQALKQEAK